MAKEVNKPSTQPAASALVDSLLVGVWADLHSRSASLTFRKGAREFSLRATSVDSLRVNLFVERRRSSSELGVLTS
jgi:hypothetical protein